MRLELNGFSAWITIEDVEQSSYSIEFSPDGSLATCWIVSEAGKNFSVHWQDLQCTFSSHGKVFVDGMGGRGRVISNPYPSHWDTQFMNGFRTSRETQRPFMFSELELTDDDRFLHAATADLGTIKLEIWRCRVFATSKKVPDRVYTYSDPQKIHERSKKGLSHRCILGPDVRDVKRSSCQTEDLCKIATFEFRYRPLAHLQANGIVPLDKKRKRGAEPNEVIDLSRDDDDNGTLEGRRIRALRAELHQLEERQRKHRKHVKVKLEAHNVKVEAGCHGDFIDLTWYDAMLLENLVQDY